MPARNWRRHLRGLSQNGLLLLELAATEAKAKAMVKKLAAIKGIEVQKMVFAH